MLSDELIEQILTTIPNKTIGVLGDLFLDRYLDIDASLNELSIETGLYAYQVVQVRSYPGALGTVINNLVALGVGRIYPISIIGDDGEGYELKQALQKMPQVHLGGILTCEGRRTPTYTKPMLKEKDQAPRELNRLDIKNRTKTPSGLEDMLMALIDEAWPQLDALIVLDQVSEEDCGVVTKRVREYLTEIAKKDREKFVLADSRRQIGKFHEVSVKFNEREWDSDFSPSGIFRKVERKEWRNVFHTRGEQGMWLLLEDGYSNTIPPYPVQGPIDIVGAGDSCSAGITSAIVAGADCEHAAAFGNLIASITIQQIGTTGSASPEQVRARWKEVSKEG
jgi:bifunctional ADP-heptose synthase (sugar kinase/adenylyltransferase)